MKRLHLLAMILLIFSMPLVFWQSYAEQSDQTGEPTPQKGSSLIAFASDRDGNAEIYLMNLNGSDLVNLTNHPRYDTAPRWVSDQGTITFSGVRDEHERQVFPYLMNLDGTHAWLIEPMEVLLNKDFGDVSQIYPSPDGQQFAFVSEKSGNKEIYVADWDNPEPINLTNNSADDDSPDWSPDSTLITFESNRTGNLEVFILDVLGASEPINLTNHDSHDFSPAWSPDGERVAFGSNREGNAEVYVTNVDGSNIKNLTENANGDWHPDWSPDGNSIVFHTDRDGNREIYVMNSDGSDPINLTNHPSEDFFPAWSPWLTLESPN